MQFSIPAHPEIMHTLTKNIPPMELVHHAFHKSREVQLDPVTNLNRVLEARYISPIRRKVPNSPCFGIVPHDMHEIFCGYFAMETDRVRDYVLFPKGISSG